MDENKWKSRLIMDQWFYWQKKRTNEWLHTYKQVDRNIDRLMDNKMKKQITKWSSEYEIKRMSEWGNIWMNICENQYMDTTEVLTVKGTGI